MVSWPPLQLRNPQNSLLFFFGHKLGQADHLWPLLTQTSESEMMIAICDSICQVSCTSARVTVLSKENKVRPFDLEPLCVFTFFFFLLPLKLKRNTVHFMQELINSRLSKHNEGGRWKEARLCACFCSRAVICLFGQSNTLLRNYHAATSCL